MQWINVEDELPTLNTQVLLYFGFEVQREDRGYRFGKIVEAGDDPSGKLLHKWLLPPGWTTQPTHWMNLWGPPAEQ